MAASWDNFKLFRRPRLFYGWWIVIAGAVALAVNSGVLFYGFGTFMLPLVREFGGGRTAIAGVFSLSRLEFGILGPISGYLSDRWGPRILMLVGIPLTGSGFLLLALVPSLPLFYLVFILITVGSGLGFFTPMVAVVTHWFRRRRGLAFGIVFSGTGLGGIMVPLLGWLIEAYGWRITAVVVGLMVWALAFPLALLVRNRPEPYGYHPDGIPIKASNAPLEESERSPATPPLEGLTAREALKTHSFWLISLSVSLRGVVTAGIAIHTIPFLIDEGLSAIAAATLWGVLALLTVPGRLGLSFLGDYVSKRYLIAGCLAVTVIALVGLSLSTTVTQALISLGAYSVVAGGLAVLPITLRADYFGRRSVGTIHGLSGSVQMVGLLLGPLIAGLAFDLTGSYGPAFWSFVGISLVSIFLILAALPPHSSRPQLLGDPDASML